MTTPVDDSVPEIPGRDPDSRAELQDAATHAVVVGESLVDIVHRADGVVTEFAGGSCANVAVALARLDRPTVLGTSYGVDRLGGAVDRYLRDSGVMARGSAADPSTRTSSAIARLNEHGAASYEFDITWDLATDGLPDRALVVHTGSIGAVLAPGAEHVRQYLQRMRRTATISYDVNARPALFGEPEDARRSVDVLVGLSDVVKASDEDIAWLFPDRPEGDVARHWLELGAAAVVITRGGDGATCYARSGRTHVEARRVTVADTIAAGDTFSAGIVDALWVIGLLGAAARDRLAALSTTQWDRVLTYAAGLASVTVSRHGADPPRLAELPPAWRAGLLPAQPSERSAGS